jgi:hypothetical protein
MAKLIFKYTDELLENLNEASEIEFTIKDELNIHEFKILCVRMASALGFHQNSIQKSFGELVYGDEEMDNELKKILDDVFTRTNNH